MSFTDQVVLITGASSGIGAATAIAFAKEGASVILVGRNESKLQDVAEECAKKGPKPLVIKADISNEEQVQAMVKESIEQFGKLNVLVNNAGLGRFGTLLDGTMLKAYDEILSTNVRAQLHVTSEAVKHLIETKGSIVNIGSVAAHTMPFTPSFSAYHISKAAFTHFTKCAALELAPHGVRVNVVSPGPTRSNFMQNAGSSFSLESVATPLGKIADAEDVADIVLFLASDKAKSITGSDYVIDNGYLLK